MPTSRLNPGILYALAAYGAWGVFPIFWKQLDAIPVAPLIAHRVVWSFVLLTSVVGISGRWRRLRPHLRDRRIVATYALAALLVGSNWMLFVGAVISGHVIDTSLGYFINPLLSVLLGVFVLGERPRRMQWVAITIAAVGVIYLTIIYGTPPWIALGLAVTFGLYGLIKKRAPLPSLEGLWLETTVLLPIALGFLIVSTTTGDATWTNLPVRGMVLLVATGVITVVPLLMFTSAARRIPLWMLGMFQYLTPTLTFTLGVFLYHEPFSTERFVGFCIVWVALVVFVIDVARGSGRGSLPVVVEAE